MAGSSDATALLLNISADNSKVLKAIDQVTKKLSDAGPQWERSGKNAAASLEKGFSGQGFGKALDKVFDSSRLAVLEAGSTRLRVFGSALEPLGPLGIAAAAGIAAVGIALDQAHKAVEFADNLYKVAKNAHITTDELQELQYALRLAGGNAEQVGPAMASFSDLLGRASAGVTRALRPFKELFGNNFTAADATRLLESGHALDTVTAAIAKLHDVAQKDAVIGQFGLDGMKLLIEEGPEKMREFTAAAEAGGYVMKAGLVTQGHELNEQLESAYTKINVQLKSAFIELGPILVILASKLADMATFAAQVAGHLNSIEHQTPEVQAEMRQRDLDRAHGPLASTLAAIGLPQLQQHHLASANRATTALLSGFAPGDASIPTGDARLNDITKHPAGPRNDTAERTDAVDAALATADKNRLSALAAETDNIQARADFEKAALDQETAAQQARLQHEIDTVNADKGVSATTKDRLTQELELAKLLDDQASQAKARKIDRDAAYAIEDLQIGVYKDITEALISQLEAQAAIATTAAQRNAIEQRILQLRQQLERDLTGSQIDKQVRLGELTPDRAAAKKGAVATTQAAAQTQLNNSQASPVQKYLNSIQDLNTEFETDGVQAVKSLSDGFASAIANAKSLGDVASNVFKQLIAQLLSAAIQRDIAGPILASFSGSSSGSGSSGGADPVALALKAASSLLGFADGTPSAPGGLAWVGERGKELVNLPRGAQVIPHNQSMAALRAMSVPRATNVTIVQPFHFHAEGVVMTDELLAQANAHANRVAVNAGQAARAASSQDFQRANYAGQLNA